MSDGHTQVLVDGLTADLSVGLREWTRFPSAALRAGLASLGMTEERGRILHDEQ